jgi:hypothetical protein
VGERTHGTTPQPSAIPSGTCEEEIALIPEQLNSDNSSSAPRFFVKPQTPYKPTDVNPGETGVSFPLSDKAYIIIFPISSAATIQSVRVPNITNANVDQIRVMFLDEKDNPISAQPSGNSPLQLTSQTEGSPIVYVNLSTKVNAVHVTLIHTSNNQPPQGVTIEIVACVEPSQRTPQTTVITPSSLSTPSTNSTSSATCKGIKLYKYSIIFFLS